MSTGTLFLVGTYRRQVLASLERIWENVMDWEHLPSLHPESFLSVKLLEITADTWRAAITTPPADHPRHAVVEVSCDRPNRRYWSRTVGGRGVGTEILTRLVPVDDRTTDITVQFRVPSVDPAKADAAVKAAFPTAPADWQSRLSPDETMKQCSAHENLPDEEGDHPSAQGNDSEPHRSRVGEILGLRLAFLGLLDEMDDLGQERVLAGPLDLDGQGTLPVDGPADDLGPRVLGDGG